MIITKTRNEMQLRYTMTMLRNVPLQLTSRTELTLVFSILFGEDEYNVIFLQSRMANRLGISVYKLIDKITLSRDDIPLWKSSGIIENFIHGAQVERLTEGSISIPFSLCKFPGELSFSLCLQLPNILDFPECAQNILYHQEDCQKQVTEYLIVFIGKDCVKIIINYLAFTMDDFDISLSLVPSSLPRRKIQHVAPLEIVFIGTPEQ